MVIQDGWMLLEKNDELIIFNRKTKRKIAEGKFHSIGCAIVKSINDGIYNNGSFITHFNIKYKDGGIHGYSLHKYKFKLKEELKSIV